MWILLPVALLLIAYSILIFWYRNAWLQLPESNHNPHYLPDALPQVSIIVPARNEAENIATCLLGLAKQTYPAALTEIWLIDDESEDETVQIAKELANTFPQIKILSIQHDAGNRAHKKKAIESGIAHSCGSIIFTTDADCTHNPNWVSTLVNSYLHNKKVFVAAPVMFYTSPTILSIFQTLDFLSLQGITGASVHKNFHAMCNGANIAYSRKAFNDVNGFAGIDSQPSGDDMLLMHKIFKQNPLGIVWLKSADALVLTQAASSWHAFFQQRIRWASKAVYYDDKRIFFVLLLVYLLNAGLLALQITALIFPAFWLYFFIALAIKTSSELFFLVPVARFFNKTKWLWLFPLFQPLHIIYTVVAGWLGRFGKYSWKGREIKL